jgi:hypothetical protein
MVENHEKGVSIKRPVDNTLQRGCGQSREVSGNFHFVVSGVQCLKQRDSEFTRRSYLSDVKRKRLIFNEGTK